MQIIVYHRDDEEILIDSLFRSGDLFPIEEMLKERDVPYHLEGKTIIIENLTQEKQKDIDCILSTLRQEVSPEIIAERLVSDEYDWSDKRNGLLPRLRLEAHSPEDARTQTTMYLPLNDEELYALCAFWMRLLPAEKAEEYLEKLGKERIL